MREVMGMLFGVLLTIVAIMIGSTLATRAWQAEPESGPARSVSVEEYRRGQTALPCPECANYILTDYRRSPSVYGPKGIYKGHFKGDQFIFDTPLTMDNLFQKEQPKGSR
jgi:hypothetical protein